MRFSLWAVLADEYAESYWMWDGMIASSNINEAYDAFYAGDSPKEFVDRIATKLGMENYPDTHSGNMPRAFHMSDYTIKPSNQGD
jgi:hypothetical protein